MSGRGLQPSALDGLRVIDLSRVLAGPLCTQMLADHGADVVKIEPPGADETRHLGPPFDDAGEAAYFGAVNRGKRALALDLSRSEAREILVKLLETADVLVENFRPGQLERLDLGPDVLHAANPRLIIARVSGYGQDGPYRDKPAFGAIGEAIGGIRHLTGHPAGASDLPPPRCGVSIGDDLAGLYAAVGLLSAVYQRDVTGTGRGRIVDVCLVDSILSLMEGMLPEYALDGRVRQPAGAGCAARPGRGTGGATGGLARKEPGRAASALKPQNVMTGLPSTTNSVSSPGAVRA